MSLVIPEKNSSYTGEELVLPTYNAGAFPEERWVSAIETARRADTIGAQNLAFTALITRVGARYGLMVPSDDGDSLLQYRGIEARFANTASRQPARLTRLVMHMGGSSLAEVTYPGADTNSHDLVYARVSKGDTYKRVFRGDGERLGPVERGIAQDVTFEMANLLDGSKPGFGLFGKLA